MASANLIFTHRHHRVLRMKLAVGQLISLADAFGRIDDVQTLKQIDINPCGVADNAENGMGLSFRNMQIQSL